MMEESITAMIDRALKSGNETLTALGHKQTKTVRLLLSVSVEIEIQADADPIDAFNTQ